MKNDILNTLLRGISKSLYVVNEVIPIYKDTAPLVKKVKGFINKDKVIDKNINTNSNNNIKKELEVKDKNINNSPKFYL